MSARIRLYHGEYPEDVLRDAAAIRARLEGLGECLELEAVADAWGAFSGALHASWLIVGDVTMANFTGWLLGEWLAGAAAPREPSAAAADAAWASYRHNRHLDRQAGWRRRIVEAVRAAYAIDGIQFRYCSWCGGKLTGSSTAPRAASPAPEGPIAGPPASPSAA